MNMFNSEGSGESEWDGKSETDWNEFDWGRYLRDSEDEVIRFLNIYNSFISQSDRLDAAASAMGWDAEDWAPDDIGGTEEDFLAQEQDDVSAEEEFSDWEPYTLHRHPLYISTRALLLFVGVATEHYIERHGGQISNISLLRFLRTLHFSESEALLGIQALELGDFALVVSHFKRGLHAINTLFRILNEFGHAEETVLHEFTDCLRIRLFDLRDIWLRVMRDCRFDQYRNG